MIRAAGLNHSDFTTCYLHHIDPAGGFHGDLRILRQIHFMDQFPFGPYFSIGRLLAGPQQEAAQANTDRQQYTDDNDPGPIFHA